MPHRRSIPQRRRKKPSRVRIVRNVAPTARRVPLQPMPLTVPTRWVKNVIAVFLLPSCAILT